MVVAVVEDVNVALFWPNKGGVLVGDVAEDVVVLNIVGMLAPVADGCPNTEGVDTAAAAVVAATWPNVNAEDTVVCCEPKGNVPVDDATAI